LRDCRNARKLTLRMLRRLRLACVKRAKRSAFGCVAVAVAVFVRVRFPAGTAAAPRLPLRAAFPVIPVILFGFRFLFFKSLGNLFGALSPKPFVLQGDCRDRIRRARRLRYEQGGFSFASSLPC
jgi:hypothetical protein